MNFSEDVSGLYMQADG